MNSIETRLRQLPEPSPAADFAARVAARIATLDANERAFSADLSPTTVSAPLRDRLAVAAAVLGAAIGASAQVFRLAIGEATFDPTSPITLGGLGATVEQFSATPATAVAAVGLALYLASWLLPLRDQ